MTEQAEFWSGKFGDDYIGRNSSPKLLSSNLFLFGQIFDKCQTVPSSILELGANSGMNYKAIKLLNAEAKFMGIEINKKAFDMLVSEGARAENISIHEFRSREKFEFVFTKGVLIHLDPASLIDTYKKMASLSSKYVMICEYFNPTPVAIDYRGNQNKLFKRDFGGEFLGENKDFSQIAEGYVSQRATFPQDNLTWSLFKRTK